jgi:F420-non-reducing hydrogenase iron-sulfur subunit
MSAEEKAAPKKTTAKKAAAKRTTAKKTAAKKTAAKKTTAKKATARKTAAGKATAKKTAAKKATASSVAVAAPTRTAAAKPPETEVKKPEAEPKKGEWNPNIVVFACNWCSYAGADTAGVSRIQHQPFFRMIRVMCSGRIQPGFVLRAFEKGADGVLVSGCHFGDCHYVSGNERAVEQFEITTNLVKLLGIEDDRLRLEWISAAEGVRFAKVIDEFTDQVRKLGPSPVARARRAG